MNAQPTTKLVIVAKNTMLVESLSIWLGHQPGLTLLGRAEADADGLDVCRLNRPDMVLVDVTPPQFAGLDLVESLRRDLPTVRVVVMSDQTDPYTIWRISRCKVPGFVEKSSQLTMLMEAITAVAGGANSYSTSYRKTENEWLTRPDACHKILTTRERHILLRVVAGWDDPAIGNELGISVHTVAVHRKNMRAKLRLRNDRALIAYANTWGFGSATNPTILRPAFA